MINDRIYLNEKDDRIWIDAYISDDGGVRPAILVIPGGGYISVSHFLEGEPIARAFFERGYNAFVLNYGVGEERDVFPKQLLDAGRAMIYIKENADKLFIDKERVFSTGFSAGGHLCGCIATMFDYPEVVAEFGERAKLVRPRGVILSYPVTVAFEEAHRPSFVNLFRKHFEAIPLAELKRASLDYAVNSQSSPMFIWHTREDVVVPVEGSMKLALAASRCGLPLMMSVYPYGPHALGLANESTSRGDARNVQPLAQVWVDTACEWMKTL